MLSAIDRVIYTTRMSDDAESTDTLVVVIKGDARRMKKSSESSSKVGVEDGVDDWIEGAVDVAQPDERRHQVGVDVT